MPRVLGKRQPRSFQHHTEPLFLKSAPTKRLGSKIALPSYSLQSVIAGRIIPKTLQRIQLGKKRPSVDSVSQRDSDVSSHRWVTWCTANLVYVVDVVSWLILARWANMSHMDKAASTWTACGALPEKKPGLWKPWALKRWYAKRSNGFSRGDKSGWQELHQHQIHAIHWVPLNQFVSENGLPLIPTNFYM